MLILNGKHTKKSLACGGLLFLLIMYSKKASFFRDSAQFRGWYFSKKFWPAASKIWKSQIKKWKHSQQQCCLCNIHKREPICGCVLHWCCKGGGATGSQQYGFLYYTFTHSKVSALFVLLLSTHRAAAQPMCTNNNSTTQLANCKFQAQCVHTFGPTTPNHQPTQCRNCKNALNHMIPPV